MMAAELADRFAYMVEDMVGTKAGRGRVDTGGGDIRVMSAV